MKNIIIVDMQKGFINKNNEVLVHNINNYLKDNHFDNVIYTRCINTKNSPFMTILGWNGMFNKEEQDFAVDVMKNSTILTKTGYGLSSEQINEIKAKGIKEVEICGTDIDACVLAIMFNLFDAGIKPKLIKDLSLSSSSNEKNVDFALAIIKRQFGIDSIL